LNHHDIDAERLQQLHFILVREQQLGGPRRRENFERVGLEGQNHGVKAQSPGIIHGAAQQRLMAEMDAVEIAQGRDRPAQRKGLLIEVANDFHE